MVGEESRGKGVRLGKLLGYSEKRNCGPDFVRAG